MVAVLKGTLNDLDRLVDVLNLARRINALAFAWFGPDGAVSFDTTVSAQHLCVPICRNPGWMEYEDWNRQMALEVLSGAFRVETPDPNRRLVVPSWRSDNGFRGVGHGIMQQFADQTCEAVFSLLTVKAKLPEILALGLMLCRKYHNPVVRALADQYILPRRIDVLVRKARSSPLLEPIDDLAVKWLVHYFQNKAIEARGSDEELERVVSWYMVNELAKAN